MHVLPCSLGVTGVVESIDLVDELVPLPPVEQVDHLMI